MIRFIYLFLLLITPLFALGIYEIKPGQLAVGDNAKPEAGAALAVQSTTQSSLPCPKMTETQRDALAVTPSGSCVYNTTSASTEFWSGSSWIKAGSSAVLDEWATASVYGVGTFVYTTPDFKLWVANTAHTAGATFAGDIANWDEASSGMAGIGSSTDNAIVRWDGTAGSTVQDSSVLVDDSDNLSGVADLTVTGTTTLATALTGVTKLTSGVVSVGDVDLTSEVTGILPTANGGTGSSSTAYADLTTNVSGILPIANGGTGSATQNFVDLTTAQSIAGVKTFSALPIFTSGVDINSVSTFDYSGASDAVTITQAGAGEALDISGGQLTIDEDILMSGTGQIDIPVGTTAQRSGSANSGMFRFNSTLGGFEGYDGSSWGTFATSGLPSVQKFTSGSGTYTTPAGVSYIKVTMVGGGGGGGSSGSAGWVTGSTGGTTTFGTSLLTATGGVGGAIPASATTGGAGGTTTINSPAINILSPAGASGGATPTTSSTAYSMGGAGAGSPISDGGGMAYSTGVNAVGNSGAGGGGGGGAATSVIAGFGGGAGGYIVAIINTPSASYSYAVGASGAGGTAGTSGNAGGNGGTGVIIVEEFY